MIFEIRKVRNGYVIFDMPSYSGNPMTNVPWVFETIEEALQFLKEKFESPPSE